MHFKLPSRQRQCSRKTPTSARAGSGRYRRSDLPKSQWLRNKTLGGIVVLSVLLAAGLIVLRQSSRRTDGIEILSDNRYLWTYGPTALLVFLVAAWRQIDHEVKILEPFAALQKGNSEARDSIRLDYVSPLQIVSAVGAYRSRHNAVVASIFGFTLLKLVTLASTALLDVREVSLAKDTGSLVRTSRFDGSLFNRTAFDLGSDSSVVYEAFGVSSYDVDRADGVGNGFVYETFREQPNALRSDSNIRVNVSTLVPDFGCSPAEVTVLSDPDETQPSNASRGRVRIDSPDCEFSGVEPTFLMDSSTVETQVVPSIQRRGSMQRVDCRNFKSTGPNTDNVQLLVLAEIEYTQEFADDAQDSTPSVGKSANVTDWKANVRRSRSIICSPQLISRRSDILYEPAQSDSVATLDGEPGPPVFFEPFTGDNLTSAFTASMLDAAGLFGDASTANGALLEDFPNTMFKMMADALFHQRSEVGTPGYEALLIDDSDNMTMTSAADVVFKAVASQLIHKYIREPTEEPLAGSLSFKERRLIVSEPSLWTMFAGILLLAVATIVVWLVQPRPTIPHHLESVVALSTHVPPNEELAHLVARTNDLDKAERDAMLQTYRFGSSWSTGPLDKRPAFELYATKAATSETPLLGAEADSKTQPQWWTPFMLRTSIVITTLTLPLIAIGVLETVYQVSLKKQQNTIVLIDEKNASTATLWLRVVPALVMLLIATLFNSIDFNIALLGPLSALKRQPIPASKFPDRSLVGALPLVALWRALNMRLWPVAASTLAALIGSVLTIVASGLFTFEAAQQSRVVNLAPSETFNTTTRSALIDPADAAALVSLLESSNLSSPANTYKELAFPSLGAIDDVASDANVALEVELPALRASLECVALSSEAFSASISLNARIQSASVSVNAQAALPDECQRGGPDGNLPFLEIPFSQTLPSNTNASYIGKLLDLHVGPYDAILDSAIGETSPNQPDNPPGCPSLALIYGLVDATTDTTNITTLICTQHLQNLTTHTFQTSSHRILNTTLISNETTAPYLPASSRDPTLTAFPFRIQQPLDQTLSIFNQTLFPSAANADSPVDPFFQGVLFGTTGLFATDSGPAAFASTADDARRTVFDALQAFYRRYMAQAVSLSMRQLVLPLPAAGGSSTAATSDNGGGQEAWRVTVHDAGAKLKLVMHVESKLTLQGMLGAMVLLMGFAVWSSGVRRQVVRANPCEIWGRLQLVVGGRLAEEARRREMEGQQDGGLSRDGWGEQMVMLAWWDRELRMGGGRRWGVDLVDGRVQGEPRERESEAGRGGDGAVQRATTGGGENVSGRPGWI